MTSCALPAPSTPGAADSWNGPAGSSEPYWRMPLTYRSTFDGTVTSPRNSGSGVVTRYGCRPKSRPTRIPPRRNVRLQLVLLLSVSPTTTLVMLSGSDHCHCVSRRIAWLRQSRCGSRYRRPTKDWRNMPRPSTPSPRPKARSSPLAVRLLALPWRLAYRS